MAKKLNNVEVTNLIQELKRLEKAEASREERTEVFNKIPQEFKVKICLGCGRDYYDCDCPAGSSESLKNEDEITELLVSRVEGYLHPNIQEEIDMRLFEIAPNLEFQGLVPQFGCGSVRVYLMASAEQIFDVKDLQDDGKLKEILNKIVREVKSKVEQFEEIS